MGKNRNDGVSRIDDRIILGTSVWVSNFAPPIRTFIKENVKVEAQSAVIMFGIGLACAGISMLEEK